MHSSMSDKLPVNISLREPAPLIRNGVAIGSGVGETSHSLSAAMGYQDYELPTPSV